MTVATVSSYSVIQTTLNNVSKVEADLQNQQMQLSSGNKSNDFAGLGSEVQQYLSLDASIRKADQYLNDNKIVEDRINATSSALSGIIDTATTLQNMISQRRSGVSNAAAFQTQLQGLWSQVVSQLNTTSDNLYIFSGTATKTPAVNDADFPELQQNGVPDAGYYLGSQQDIVGRPQDNSTVVYNVRADNPGIQKIMAALAMARKGDANRDDVDLGTAYSLVQSGIQDVISAQASVNANKVLYTSIDQKLQNTKLYWKGLQESIGNTDILSVSTQVAVNQGILQAAFQSFAKISSLKLSDYLR